MSAERIAIVAIVLFVFVEQLQVLERVYWVLVDFSAYLYVPSGSKQLKSRHNKSTAKGGLEKAFDSLNWGSRGRSIQSLKILNQNRRKS